MNRPTNHPTLSVIVPMHQSGPTVARTIESILAEHVEGDLEVIVVNDGSTDDGPSIAQSFARADSRLRMISQPNSGLAAARNAGIDLARGRWLRFVDADDWVSPGASQRLIDCAIRRRVSAACAAQELVDEHGSPLGRTSPALGGPDGTIGPEHFLDSNRCGVGTVVVAAAALGDLRFIPSLGVWQGACEDWETWLMLGMRGVRFAVCPGDPVLSYRVRRASLSKDFSAMLRTGQDVLRRAYAHARGLAIAGLDCSLRREQVAMRLLALQWATLSALSDRPGRTEEASEMFADSGAAEFAGTEAASAAMSAALVGLGIRPEADDSSAALWVERTARWWETCILHGWLDRAQIDRAWHTLSEMAVLPMDTARACVRDALATEPTSVVVVGAGENGRLIARAAEELGARFTLRDDRIDDGRLGVGDLPGGARTEPMHAPMGSGVALIVSPANDAVLVERFAARSLVRWTQVRRRLSSSILKRTRRRHSGHCGGRESGTFVVQGR